MPDFQGDRLYRTREEIFESLVANMVSLVPDVWTGEDGNLMILFQVESGQIEGVYLANQLVLHDIFIQTASVIALERHGDQWGFPLKAGVNAEGEILFTGAGGTYIPVGTEVSTVQTVGDPLYFLTTEDGTIPNPGVPTPPTTAEGAAGNITGLVVYAITFLTDQGETLLGSQSSSLAVSGARVDLTDVPIGGPGTIGRNIYRSTDGSDFAFVDTIADNTTVVYEDNVATPTGDPPEISLAERVLIAAHAEEPGDEYNVNAQTITIPTDVPDGISAVTNPDVFTLGVDPEDWEAYRIRLLEKIRNPETGSKGDLEMWAEQIDGIDSASAFPNENLGTPENGHVTVRVAGPNGTVPDAALLTEVQDFLDSQDIMNMTIHVTTFTPVSVDVTLNVTLETDFSLAEVENSVIEAVEDYINGVPVGGTAYVAGIVDAVFGLSGVATLDVTVPTGDVTTTDLEKTVPGTITVT